jgi:hypothetical protein
MTDYLYRNITVSKLLFDCYQVIAALLKPTIVHLLLEVDFFQLLYPVLFECNIWFQSILNLIHAFHMCVTPSSQRRIVLDTIQECCSLQTLL